MNRRIFHASFLVFCLLLLSAGLCLGQETATDDTHYPALLARLNAQDKTLDFRALRFAHADHAQDSPAKDIGAQQVKRSLFNALSDRDHNAALKHCSTLLEADPLDIDAHVGCMITRQNLRDEKKAAFHRYAARGLVNSIMAGGDGRSPEAAWEVVTVEEEYSVLRVLGLSRESQSLSSQNGHMYDVLTVTNPETNETFDLYFKVDRVFEDYKKMLQD